MPMSIDGGAPSAPGIAQSRHHPNAGASEYAATDQTTSDGGEKGRKRGEKSKYTVKDIIRLFESAGT